MQVSKVAGIQISESVLSYKVAQLPLKAGTMENPLAQRLRMRRDERGLTQAELAQKLGMATSQYNRYEKGADPSTELLAKIAVILACTSDFLLGLVDDPQDYLEEVALPQDEKGLLHSYREAKRGNKISKQEQRWLRDLAPDNAETALIEASQDTDLPGDKKVT